eukprot:765171-Hanusia_phi.AAC.3
MAGDGREVDHGHLYLHVMLPSACPILASVFLLHLTELPAPQEPQGELRGPVVAHEGQQPPRHVLPSPALVEFLAPTLRPSESFLRRA